jgi:hypothetical protein
MSGQVGRQAVKFGESFELRLPHAPAERRSVQEEDGWSSGITGFIEVHAWLRVCCHNFPLVRAVWIQNWKNYKTMQGFLPNKNQMLVKTSIFPAIKFDRF